ncbi:MAG: hypothetical protein OEW87_12820, partial [Flavobacteriaceae bacterium]|nr:hypothetical protein [Flavobacteriaceae bacterium]
MLLVLVSCSTPLAELWGEREDTEKRSQKILKDDFKFEKKVFDKFVENKTEAKKPESIVTPHKTTLSKVSSEKIQLKRKAIRPRPSKKIQRKKKAQIIYPKDFPDGLKKLDRVSRKFWTDFNPVMVPGEKAIYDVTYLGVHTGTMTIKTE